MRTVGLRETSERCWGCDGSADGGIRFRVVTVSRKVRFVVAPLCEACRRIWLALYPVGSRVPGPWER